MPGFSLIWVKFLMWFWFARLLAIRCSMASSSWKKKKTIVVYDRFFWGWQNTMSLLVTTGLVDGAWESGVDDMIENEFRMEWRSFSSCQSYYSLVPFGFATTLYLHLCIHGLINNEERHRAVLIFSVHRLHPSFLRLLSMLASFPHRSTMAEAPVRCPVHTTIRAHRSPRCISRSGEAFTNNRESAWEENYLYHPASASPSVFLSVTELKYK